MILHAIWTYIFSRIDLNDEEKKKKKGRRKRQAGASRLSV